LILFGDGIGLEIMDQSVCILGFLNDKLYPGLVLEEALIGDAALDAVGVLFPNEMLVKAK